jgi:hypothetical protein
LGALDSILSIEYKAFMRPLGGANEALAISRTLTQRQLAEKYRIENAILKGDHINRADLAKGLARIADAMVSRITASELSAEAKEDLLKELASLPLVLEEVVRGQSKLRKSKAATKEARDDSD